MKREEARMSSSPLRTIEEAHDFFFGSIEGRLSEEQQAELDRRLTGDPDFHDEWRTLAEVHEELCG